MASQFPDRVGGSGPIRFHRRYACRPQAEMTFRHSFMPKSAPPAGRFSYLRWVESRSKALMSPLVESGHSSQLDLRFGARADIRSGVNYRARTSRGGAFMGPSDISLIAAGF